MLVLPDAHKWECTTGLNHRENALINGKRPSFQFKSESNVIINVRVIYSVIRQGLSVYGVAVCCVPS